MDARQACASARATRGSTAVQARRGGRISARPGHPSSEEAPGRLGRLDRDPDGSTRHPRPPPAHPPVHPPTTHRAATHLPLRWVKGGDRGLLKLAQQRQPRQVITLKTADAVLILEHAMISEGLK